MNLLCRSSRWLTREEMGGASSVATSCSQQSKRSYRFCCVSCRCFVRCLSVSFRLTRRLNCALKFSGLGARLPRSSSHGVRLPSARNAGQANQIFDQQHADLAQPRTDRLKCSQTSSPEWLACLAAKRFDSLHNDDTRLLRHRVRSNIQWPNGQMCLCRTATTTKKKRD